MPKALSNDIRNRIIWSKFIMQERNEEIAMKLFVSPRTVSRICNKYLRQGSVDANKTGRPRGSTVLHPHEEYILMKSVLEKPDLRLHELADIMLEQTGSMFSLSTLWRELGRQGFTNKKVSVLSLVESHSLNKNVIEFFDFASRFVELQHNAEKTCEFSLWLTWDIIQHVN